MTVAGEDLSRGDYVARLNEIVSFPSYMWDGCGHVLKPDEMVRLRMIPKNAGQPLRVTAVCLPFVYAESRKGKLVILDIRDVELVRLDKRCAKAVWKSKHKSRK